MLYSRFIHTVFFSAAITCSVAAFTTQAEDFSSLIDERQKGFKTMGRNLKIVRTEFKGESPDFSVVETALLAIQTEAKKVSGWFPSGSGPESGLETDALAYIWKNTDKFSTLAGDLETATEAFLTAAKSSDVSASKNALNMMKDACSSCHKSFRAD